MKAILWSKYHCPYCDQAKALLKQKGYEIEERKIGDGYTKEELLEAVPTARTVPDRKSTRLNSSHIPLSRMPSSA